MAVPDILKNKKSRVFCYSQDLLDASNKLSLYLGNGCDVIKIYNNEQNNLADDKSKAVAWLVGHGDKDNIMVGNNDHSKGYNIDDISDWLIKYGYQYLVDTCCYPDKRKLYQKFKNQYYCPNDGICVQLITDPQYKTFDSWWDNSKMHQYIP